MKRAFSSKHGEKITIQYGRTVRWAITRQANLQPSINLPTRILLHHLANYGEQVSTWHAKLGGMTVPAAKRLREIEVENAQFRSF